MNVLSIASSSEVRSNDMAKITFVWPCSSHAAKLLNLGFKTKLFFLILFILTLLFFMSDGRNTFWRTGTTRYSSKSSHNTLDSDLEYGVVIDAGSSGSRAYIYVWPPHVGVPQELLQIRPLTSESGEPLVKKISPGLSSVANNPKEASDYIYPLLAFAAEHIPEQKLKATPLYILATAGLRLLDKSVQEAILSDVQEDIPKNFSFIMSPMSVEVISGKQEGVYQWIAINFGLGRFSHNSGDDLIAVDMPNPLSGQVIFRKQTVGILDMGGASLQLAMEISNKVDLERLVNDKNVMTEVNLGCTEHDEDHKYTVYVTTFLGMGANEIRQKYEELLLESIMKNRTEISSHLLLNDPCLPKSYEKKMNISSAKLSNETLVNVLTIFKGAGDFDACQLRLVPLVKNLTHCPGKSCLTSQLPLQLENNDFYGFSEFWYSMEDVFREGGSYQYHKFRKTAMEFCSTPWPKIRERFERHLYPKADWQRLTNECFKAVWMTVVLHEGLGFNRDFRKLRSSPNTVHGKVLHWTLGALVHRTRFLPLRQLQKTVGPSGSRQFYQNWSLYLTYYIPVVCFALVLAAILLYLQRLQCLRKTFFRKNSPYF